MLKLDFANKNLPLKLISMNVDNVESNNADKRKCEDVACREFNADWRNLCLCLVLVVNRFA